MVMVSVHLNEGGPPSSNPNPKSEKPGVGSGHGEHRKKPWQMTWREYLNSRKKPEKGELGGQPTYYAGDMNRIYHDHKRHIENALIKGLDVPPEVLDGYRDLAKKYSKEAAY